jgi:hypothetical protein
MRHCFFALLVLFVWTYRPHCVMAEEIGFKFSGSVTMRFSDPYGKSIPVSTPIFGRFVYDTASVATHTFSNCGDCTGFEQRIVNGFAASFGGVLIRADDYLILVSNDSPVNPNNPSQGVHDVFTIEFLSTLSPALTDPMIVAGDSETAGRFSVSMSANSNAFSDSSLPSDLDPNAFPVSGRVGILSHSATGLPDIGFSVNSFSSYRVFDADYNFDEVVDQNDYDSWRTMFGNSIQIDADGNHNRLVDAADYVVWRKSLEGGSASAARVIPEPSLLVLISILAAIGLSKGRRSYH